MKLIEPQPDADVVNALEDLLAAAKAGDLLSIVGLAWHRAGHNPEYITVGTLSPLATQGALRELGFMLDDVTE